MGGVISGQQPFPVGARIGMLTLLLAAFGVQTYLVYTDDTGRAFPPLSEEALAGRAVWLEYNCQACHQFYGFGGFLGPDLTNAADRLDDVRMDLVLTEGIGQMPPFQLQTDQIRALHTYLREMNATGIGQAKVPQLDLDVFRAAVLDVVPDEHRAGANAVVNGACIACHAGLASRRIGPYLAPDLSVTVAQMSDDSLMQVLGAGRPALGMPPTGLPETQRVEIAAFLRWLVDNRARVRDAAGDAGDPGLPWWEFR